MRRMIPQKLIDFVKALKGGDADLEVGELTSKGISNTGSLGNIGDAVISGDLYVQSDTEDNGNLDVEGDATIGGDVEATGGIEANSFASSQIIQLNAEAFDATKFEVVQATCEVINDKARIYRIVFNVLEDITGTYLNLQGLLPSGPARPSRTWVGKYLPDNTANTTADVKFNAGGDVYLYSITYLKANKQAEVVVMSLW